MAGNIKLAVQRSLYNRALFEYIGAEEQNMNILFGGRSKHQIGSFHS